LGKNESAIKLQLLAAMIAFLLLRIAAQTHGVTLPPLRFVELAGRFLFARRPVAWIDEPPPKYRVPSRWIADNQLQLAYA